MILVDTSVWVDHLRVADRQLAGLLLEEAVLCHPFVVGELACGALNPRSEILSLLRNLTQAPVVEHEEVLTFLEAHALRGSGLGWVRSDGASWTASEGQSSSDSRSCRLRQHAGPDLCRGAR